LYLSVCFRCNYTPEIGKFKIYAGCTLTRQAGQSLKTNSVFAMFLFKSLLEIGRLESMAIFAALNF
jgi:hypothetical protein